MTKSARLKLLDRARADADARVVATQRTLHDAAIDYALACRDQDQCARAFCRALRSPGSSGEQRKRLVAVLRASKKKGTP